jgi:hypothetical protein
MMLVEPVKREAFLASVPVIASTALPASRSWRKWQARAWAEVCVIYDRHERASCHSV